MKLQGEKPAIGSLWKNRSGSIAEVVEVHDDGVTLKHQRGGRIRKNKWITFELFWWPVCRDCICLRCDSEDFVILPQTILEQDYKGVQLFVYAPAMACKSCGWITVGVHQVDELCKRTKDAYDRYLEKTK